MNKIIILFSIVTLFQSSHMLDQKLPNEVMTLRQRCDRLIQAYKSPLFPFLDDRHKKLSEEQLEVGVRYMIEEKSVNPHMYNGNRGANCCSILEHIANNTYASFLAPLFLNYGADPNDYDTGGEPPLITAAISGNIRLVEMLLADPRTDPHLCKHLTARRQIQKYCEQGNEVMLHDGSMQTINAECYRKIDDLLKVAEKTKQSGSTTLGFSRQYLFLFFHEEVFPYSDPISIEKRILLLLKMHENPNIGLLKASQHAHLARYIPLLLNNPIAKADPNIHKSSSSRNSVGEAIYAMNKEALLILLADERVDFNNPVDLCSKKSALEFAQSMTHIATGEERIVREEIVTLIESAVKKRIMKAQQ